MYENGDAQHSSNGSAIVTSESTSWWQLSHWFKWKPTSMSQLAIAERNILSSIWHLIESKFVVIGNGSRRIRTISLNTKSPNTPLVLVHGMGSGVGLWILSLENLSRSRPIHAFDLLGFGLSSRPRFNSDATLAEMEFIDSMEEWRREMKLDRFVLLGHSLGGFLACSYALRHPERVEHLILVDPWGFAERPEDGGYRRIQIPVWVKVIARALQPFNPLAGLRAAGPWGPGLVSRFRPDLIQKFSHLFTDDTVAQYIYHCNAQTPSGEAAFKNMTIPFGWAKNPMVLRMGLLSKDVPISFIYGSRSWIDNEVGYHVKYLRNDSYVDIQNIRGAGHHVYADRADDFNKAVNIITEAVDKDRHQQSQQVSSTQQRRRHSYPIDDLSATPERLPQSDLSDMPTVAKLEILTTGSNIMAKESEEGIGGVEKGGDGKKGGMEGREKEKSEKDEDETEKRSEKK